MFQWCTRDGVRIQSAHRRQLVTNEVQQEMKMRYGTGIAAWLMALAVLCTGVSAQDGWESIFDGKTLDKWDGNPDFWRVEDGAITGETTADKPTKGNTFIIWRGGET